MYIYDKDGKQYIDGYAGGACVSCLGHSQESIIDAVREQIGNFAFCSSTLSQN